MGIITRLLHRSNLLRKNPFKQLFIDLGENIHIHYRDLRIELGVEEFKEFSTIFNNQSQKVINLIKEHNYRDGLIPNTNQSDTIYTINDFSQLKTDVQYHPTRVSIEETMDGIHLHYRNLKILLDKKSFTQLLDKMKKIDLKTEQKISDILKANDIPFNIISNDPENLFIDIKEEYQIKTSQILKGLGYISDRDMFKKNGKTITLKGEVNMKTFLQSIYPKLNHNNIIRYNTEYEKHPLLKNSLSNISNEDFNMIMLQILDFFKYSKNNNLSGYFNYDINSIMYDQTNNRVVFTINKIYNYSNPDKKFREISSFFSSVCGSMLKPKKFVYDSEKRSIIKNEVGKYIDALKQNSYIDKIYILGSLTNNDFGVYKVPFVHMDWVKLGSDIDLLIEMSNMENIPTDWERKFYVGYCSSEYYHLPELSILIDNKFTQQFPNVHFKSHIVEAYLFDQKKGNNKIKDEYLSRIKANLVYDRGNVTKQIIDQYNLSPSKIEKINQITFNDVYTVHTQTGKYLLKSYLNKMMLPVCSDRLDDHIKYELDLIFSLKNIVNVVQPIPNNEGYYVSVINGKKSVLFSFVDGKMYNGSNAQLANSALLMSNMHDNDRMIHNYGFYSKDYISFWFKEYNKEDLPEIKINLDELFGRTLKELNNHGDYSPRNMIFKGDTPYIIDFNTATYGPRLVDVADGAIEFSYNQGYNIDKVNQFVNLYTSKSNLTETEINSLKEFLLISAATKLIKLIKLKSFNIIVDKNRISSLKRLLNKLI